MSEKQCRYCGHGVRADLAYERPASPGAALYACRDADACGDRIAALRTCECCEYRGPRGEVEPQLEDGEQGLWVILCVDGGACLRRFHALMARWHAANTDVLTVYDDSEIPF